MKSNQKGFTLIEILIVIAVIVLLVTLGQKYIPQLFGQTGTLQEGQLLNTGIAQIRSLKHSKPDFTGFTTAEVANSGVFPDQYIRNKGTNTATVVNQWGGSLSFAPANVNGTNDGFTVTDTAIPENVCKGIPSSVSENAYSITIGTSAVKTAGGTVNDAAVGTACSGATNTVIITVTKQ
jgi:prepilin-type N-terminal cleavage/methylation domain-containing protein